MSKANAAVLDSPAVEVGERHADLIFDIGMNICEDTDFYLAKGFRVVAVEADPASCAKAETRFADQISEGRLTVLNCAIADTDEPLRFFVCRTMSAWSTASPELRDQWAKQGAEFDEIEVPAITSARLIERYGIPRYAKIDIEGYDLLCLAGFKAAHAAPEYLSVEVDFFKLDELISTLRELGYSRFALIGQSTIPQQRPRPNATEGEAISYTFAEGCSGHFGDELAAEWVDAVELRRRCQRVVQQYRASGLFGRFGKLPLAGALIDAARKSRFPLAQDWYDIHAKR